MHITRERIRQILNEDLGTRKTCVEVCLSLALEQKKHRVTNFIPTCHTSPHFVECIINADESWLFQCFPQDKTSEHRVKTSFITETQTILLAKVKDQNDGHCF